MTEEKRGFFPNLSDWSNIHTENSKRRRNLFSFPLKVLFFAHFQLTESGGKFYYHFNDSKSLRGGNYQLRDEKKRQNLETLWVSVCGQTVWADRDKWIFELFLVFLSQIRNSFDFQTKRGISFVLLTCFTLQNFVILCLTTLGKYMQSYYDRGARLRERMSHLPKKDLSKYWSRLDLPFYYAVNPLIFGMIFLMQFYEWEIEKILHV